MNAPTVIVFVCDDGRWFYTGTRDDDDRPVIVPDPDSGLIYLHAGCAANDYRHHARPLSTRLGGFVSVSPVDAERDIIAARHRAKATA